MEQHIDRASMWALMAGLARMLAQGDEELAIWTRADAVFAQLIGHQLFTVLGYDERAGEVFRIYSNRPCEYPISGRKAMGATPWGERVLKRGRCFVGRNAAHIQWAFPDHELIASMGLESALNVPIRVDGATLGTVNLLHVADWYHDAHIDVGTVVAALLAPVLLTHHGANTKDKGN